MPASDINQIIDLERYPLDQPDHPTYAQLLAAGRRSLEDKALFSMAQFVRAEAIVAMVKELEALLPLSCRFDQARDAYTYAPRESGWPENHPRRQVHQCAYNQVLNYQIPNDSSLRQIYYWQPLADFLRILCGYETFYRSECPHLALTSKIAGAGDTDGWHYDSNDVVFSLLLQHPEAGGEFEYAPYIRSQTDENYAGVSVLLADPEHNAERPPMALGDFNVFMGDLSLHRVTPVEGTRKRIVALFSYDRNPGTTFDQWYIRQLSQGLLN